MVFKKSNVIKYKEYFFKCKENGRKKRRKEAKIKKKKKIGEEEDKN